MLKLKTSEVNIWFTSDTHFYHKNITRGVSEWDRGGKTRDFDTIEEMTDSIINGINKYVKKDDILFHLGDWSFGGIDKIWEARKRIDCENIYLIAGNHDLKIIEDKILPNCQWLMDFVDFPSLSSFQRTSDIIDISESTRVSDALNQVSARNVFNYIGLANLIQIDKTLVYMSHFPSKDVRYDKKSIHLHGHKHGKFNDDNLLKERLDVGVDSAYMIFGEYKPFSWNEVINIVS